MRQIREKVMAAQKTLNAQIEQLKVLAEKWHDAAQSAADYRVRESLTDPAIMQQQIISLTTEYQRAKDELSGLQSDYGPNHPKIRAAQTRITMLKNALQDTQSLQAQNDAASMTYKELERVAEVDRIQYEDFLNKSKALSTEIELQQPDIEILSLAHAPLKPYDAPKWAIIILATAMGLVLGLIAAILVHQFEKPL